MSVEFPRLKILFAIFALVVIDQIFKNAAMAFLSSSSTILSGHFSFEIYKNYGIAFGIPVPGGLFYFAIFVFSLLVFTGKFLDLRRLDGRQTAGLVFLLAGAAGNIIDRLRWGYIVDFVSIKGALIFNLADILIVIGGIVLLGGFLDLNKERVYIDKTGKILKI